ncbi:MAG TPA: hypothetical protein VM223_17840 [Planctomycetota bacterium]|nr:hypothetical protein [Planctomycetota bacterium]
MTRWHDGETKTSHEQATDSQGRITKYVYDNPVSGRAVMVLNCNHQFDQEFTNGEAEVRASLDFHEVPGNPTPVMKLSVVVMLRKDAAEKDPSTSTT